jgi:hypothetical protein
MLKFYDELASWWHLISNPADYADEAAFFLPLFSEVTSRSHATMLELGSGGGNNALHMKSSFSSVTLVDLSPQMLQMSEEINPGCEHLTGDMRTIRLNRTFDAVFVHDALDYMTSLEDLQQAIETVFVHCKAGGMALFVPDTVRETFEPSTDHGGEDGEGRGVRYLEWTYDPDESDHTYITDYIFVLREDDKSVRVEHDQHTLGLYSRDEWLRLLQDVGFEAEYIIDPFDRHVFIGRRTDVRRN